METATAFESIQEEVPGLGFGTTEDDLEKRRKLAANVEEYDTFYTGLLQDYFTNAIKHRRLFMNVLKDPRKKNEMWRSFAPMPYGWSALKALSSSFTDLLFSLSTSKIIRPLRSSL